MSIYFSEKYKNLVPYTPGEQPRDQKYIKLNTNESPFPPSEKAQSMALEAAGRLNLYSDPECRALREALAKNLSVDPDEVIAVNGSDEVLNFAFMAYCDEATPAVFPDITYGFYKVFAEINRVPARVIPLREDFTIAPEDYFNAGGTVFIANPNAPTGIFMPLSDIERILEANRESVVVVDEAYVDFGSESAVSLINKYDNLLVTRTYSKSRSMAGARLGFGVACRELIRDLNTVRYSTNPYNVNMMTMAAGIGALLDEEYTVANCRAIIENREYTARELRRLGFELTDSAANFVFAKHPKVSGEAVYSYLRECGILVRHFSAPRICDYNRITIGTREQMETLVAALEKIPHGDA